MVTEWGHHGPLSSLWPDITVLCPPQLIATYRPHYRPILDISSAGQNNKITAHTKILSWTNKSLSDYKLDTDIAMIISSPNYQGWPASQAQCLRRQIRWSDIRHEPTPVTQAMGTLGQTSAPVSGGTWREFSEKTLLCGMTLFIIFVIFGHRERWDSF